MSIACRDRERLPLAPRPFEPLIAGALVGPARAGP